MSNNVFYIEMKDILNRLYFSPEDLDFLKYEQIEFLKNTIQKKHIIAFLYKNSLHVKYDKINPNLIIDNFNKMDLILKGNRDKVSANEINEDIFFDFVKNNKNNNAEIKNQDLTFLGQHLNDVCILYLIENILINSVSYAKFLQSDLVISNISSLFIEHQLKYDKYNEKFYLYELDRKFIQLKEKIDANIFKFIKVGEVTFLGNEDLNEKYHNRKTNPCNENEIKEEESIFSFTDQNDLMNLYYLLPTYFYFSFINEDKINRQSEKTINYVYRLIDKNLSELKKLNPIYLSSMCEFIKK